MDVELADIAGIQTNLLSVININTVTKPIICDVKFVQFTKARSVYKFADKN